MATKARKAPKPDSQAVPQATSSSSVEARQAQASDSRPASNAAQETGQALEQNAEPVQQTSSNDAGNAGSNAPTPKEPVRNQEQAKQTQQASTQDAGNASTASDATPKREQPPGEATQAATQTAETDAGNVPASTPEPSAAELTAARACVRERLQKHAEWPRIVATVREMRGSPELAAMTTEARERFIWGEMDRLYPPPVEGKSDMRVAFETPLKPDPVSTSDKSGVKGLSDIPPGWPALPANASLAAEVAWVQANRLYVVEELASGGTRVHLDRAHEPAPSRSAIGWLETSIRSYAKFVEVAAKASTGATDDGEQVRREKMQIEEIRGLLAEMAGNPPAPGR